ncbi:hypothetical protein N7453_001680 [Penicillium expansum]|nr:hypothetical protein N7453_001680 [Penicillium expansum]
MDDVKDPKLQNKRNETVMDAELLHLEEQVHSLPRSRFEMTLSNPVNFTYILVAFASMGGMLSGLDQSLISGASLYLPIDLGLSSADNSLVNAGMPLGAVFGALLSPANEYLGRRMAIIVSCILYTIGAALEAGAINFGIVFAGRFILGAGVGLEGGTVTDYVAECVPRKLRGNLVSLYQLNIALGEVLGYAIAAMFVSVEGNWRYILGSSSVFSTILFVGMLFLPRFLMHKGRVIEAYAVWKKIRGLNDFEAKDEFFGMRQAVTAESQEQSQRNKYPWMDFFTVPRAHRAMVYANIMVFLGQFTGVNAVMYYMSTLMQAIGFGNKDAVFMSLVGGGALLIGAIPAVLYMERFGRRYWANAMLPDFFIGLTLGFYGGIAVLGWVYQIIFMPETKNKSLEDIDELFSLRTAVIVKLNLKQTAQVIWDLSRFRLKKVFSPEPYN